MSKPEAKLIGRRGAMRRRWPRGLPIDSVTTWPRPDTRADPEIDRPRCRPQRARSRWAGSVMRGAIERPKPFGPPWIGFRSVFFTSSSTVKGPRSPGGWACLGDGDPDRARAYIRRRHWKRRSARQNRIFEKRALTGTPSRWRPVIVIASPRPRAWLVGRQRDSSDHGIGRNEIGFGIDAAIARAQSEHRQRSHTRLLDVDQGHRHGVGGRAAHARLTGRPTAWICSSRVI